MIKRKILYESWVSLHTLGDWFGEDAIRAALEITDIIAPWVDNQDAVNNYWYEMYVVVQNGYAGRLLSNLFKGLPSFYPIRKQYLPNETGGFIDFELPNETLKQLDLVSVKDVRLFPPKSQAKDRFVREQKIISSHSLRYGQVKQIFGNGANICAEYVDAILRDTRYEAPVPYMRNYHGYVVQQFNHESQLVYEGLIYSNLLPECPILYPIRPLRYAANLHKGYRSIDVPKEILKEVKKVDFGNALVIW